MNVGMDNTNVEVVLSLTDNGASTGMRNFTDTLVSNRSAMRELYSGATYTGSAMLGLGVAMKNSNIQALQATGNLLSMAGGFFTAVGAAGHMISAISRITSALNKMNIAQMLANLLQGPLGWAKLAGAAVVAAGVGYGVTKMMSASGTSVSPERGNITVNQHIAGSVVTRDQITDDVHQGLLLKQSRSSSTGIK